MSYIDRLIRRRVEDIDDIYEKICGDCMFGDITFDEFKQLVSVWPEIKDYRADTYDVFDAKYLVVSSTLGKNPNMDKLEQVRGWCPDLFDGWDDLKQDCYDNVFEHCDEKEQVCDFLNEWFKDYKKCFISACKSQHLGIAKKMISKNDEQLFQLNKNEIDKIFENICLSGDLEFMKWFLDQYKVNNMVKKSFYPALTYGNLHIVENLISQQSNYSLPDKKFMCSIFTRTCSNGHLESAKWILNKYPGIANHEKIINEAFSISIYFRRLSIMKWLKLTFSNLFKPTFRINSLVQIGYDEMDIETIKQLLKWYPEIITKVSSSNILSQDQKVEIIKPVMAKLKIKYFIIKCLYNTNTKFGRKYMEKFLLDDNIVCR